MSVIHHYDLFAGIGGFSLALEEIFHDYKIRTTFCEKEEFPTAVLKKHWPEGEFWGDIADFIAHTSSEGPQGTDATATPGESGPRDSYSIVTGGFPCQPFSAAGRRRGTADDRYQWPNMFAAIRNIKPDWVIAENVRGLANWNEGMVLEQICSDLEGEAYEVQPFIVPAVAVDAPHRRDRIWIVAHTTNQRSVAEMGLERKSESEATKSRSRSYPDWRKDWREVAVATCNVGMDDGIPRRVVRLPNGSTISRAKWRHEGIKAYGNAIVPQVAMKIFDSIRKTDGL